MKKIILSVMTFIMTAGVLAAAEPVKLNAPDLNRGKSTMQALSERQSVRAYADRQLSLQDMGDLLWAANGVNRPETGGRTAPSAMNSQDIKVYVTTAEGSYLYNHKEHSLEPIAKGDFRQAIRGAMPAANVILVADEESRWSMVDAGHVSQNIYLFCAANQMGTVCCGSMDEPAFRKALNLDDKQVIAVQLPVGYLK